MKKTTVWLIVGAIAAFAWFKYRMASLLQYSFGGISLGTGNVLTPTLLVDINITNPTSTSSTINAINVDIISNGSNIGSVNATYNQVIAANSTSVLELPVNIQVVGLLADIITTIQSKGAIFEIKGTITADLLPVPIDITYNF